MCAVRIKICVPALSVRGAAAFLVFWESIHFEKIQSLFDIILRGKSNFSQLFISCFRPSSESKRSSSGLSLASLESPLTEVAVH